MTEKANTKLAIALRAKIRTVIDKAYMAEAPQKATRPYAVFTFQSSFKTGEREDIPVDIDIYTKGLNDTEVESLEHEIRQALHKTNLHTEHFNAYIVHTGKSLDLSGGPKDKRRKVRFLIQTYYKS